MTFISELGDREAAACMGLFILMETLAQNICLRCTSKNGKAKGVINDAIVGLHALGNKCQTNEFQRCFYFE